MSKTFDMKITSCWVVEPQRSIKIAFLLRFQANITQALVVVPCFFLIFEAAPIVLQELWKKPCDLFLYMKYDSSKLKKYTKVKMVKKLQNAVNLPLWIFRPKHFGNLLYSIINIKYQKMKEIKISNYQNFPKLPDSYRNWLLTDVLTMTNFFA